MLLLWLLAQDAGAMVARTHALLTGPRCEAGETAADLTVCGRRQADRYRVPLIVHDPGDPRYEGVPAERERLLHRTNPVEELSPFLVGGGFAGVTATAGGGKTSVGTARPLAP